MCLEGAIEPDEKKTISTQGKTGGPPSTVLADAYDQLEAPLHQAINSGTTRAPLSSCAS